MALLSSKTTTGDSSFNKYVKNNPKWKELELTIENKKQSIFYAKDKKKMLNILEEGTKFTLQKNELTSINSIDCVKVKVGNLIGFIPINKIRKPTKTNVLEAEEVAIRDLDKLIKDLIKQVGPPTICIKIGNFTHRYEDVIGARTVTKNPLGRAAKSDFSIFNSKNLDLIQISHKKIGGPEAYQQYGGISNKSGSTSNPKLIYNNNEVQLFLSKVIDYIKNDKLIHSVYSPIESDELINQTVYGPDYGNNFGIDNVQMIGQGNPILIPKTKEENCFDIKFSSHTSYNGDSKFFKSGNYKAVLAATYRSGRGFDYKGDRFTGARIGIYPIALIKGRKKAKEI